MKRKLRNTAIWSSILFAAVVLTGNGTAISVVFAIYLPLLVWMQWRYRNVKEDTNDAVRHVGEG